MRHARGIRIIATAILAVGALATCAPRRARRATPSPLSAPGTFIAGATVIDGSGEPRQVASVRIIGDRIVGVGALAPRPGDTVVNGAGLVLAPGFVDSHSHADRALFERRDALAAVSQGITTLVVGQDGDSPYPLADFFARVEREPPAVNVASYAGHGTIREQALRADFRRPATEAELERMRVLLRDELRAGALGLSTGLEYDPGIYSEPREIIELAKVAAADGGRYISHIRSEDRAFWSAVSEIITIGREARLPVQLSHAKLAMRSLWGHADSLLRVLDRARASGVEISADIYPYTYWQSTLTVLFPERDFESRRTAEFVLRELAAPSGLLMSQFDPDPSYVGKTVADISTLRGTDSVTTLIAMIREAEAMSKAMGRGSESVIGTSMDERDVERIMAWPFANIGSDGGLTGRHPRGFGTFPRVLGRYVRERGVLTLEDAIRKMTTLSALNLGLRDRGGIAPGMHADLVLFDPVTVLDRATLADPQAVSAGIRTVWVNGRIVFRDGAATGERPGRVVRREGAAARRR